jgi:ribonuclease PH
MTQRRPDQMRPTVIVPFATGAPGSVLIKQGGTHVLCTASIERELPRWLQPKGGEPPTRGWVTAEYAMLPGATPDRKKRGLDSRATEIQRLIGRVLRAAVDLEKMPGVMITCDCDVLRADGGTRTASITGAFVALAQALAAAQREGLIAHNPMRGPVAAVNVGVVGGKRYLDLDYALDVRAEVDLNVAMNHKSELVEVQGTAEGATFSRAELDKLLDLAAGGIRKLIQLQRRALRG